MYCNSYRRPAWILFVNIDNEDEKIWRNFRLRRFLVILFILSFLPWMPHFFKSNNGYVTPSQSAIINLLRIASRVNLPVIVIDVDFLRAVQRLGNNEMEKGKEKKCYYFCKEGVKSITVATLSSYWNLNKEKSDMLWEFGTDFEINTLPTKTNQTYGIPVDKVDRKSHFLFIHRVTKVEIHFVVFFNSSDSQSWHAQIDMDKLSSDFVTKLDYGAAFVGVYSRWALESKIIYLDDVQISVPANISMFLRAKEESRFKPCNASIVRNYVSEHKIKLQRAEEELTDFRSNVRDILNMVTTAMGLLRIPFWISSGTCLGWYRQCDLIPNSKDVDIGVFVKDYDSNLRTVFEVSGLRRVHSFGKISDSYELSFMSNNVKLDVFFFYEEEDHVWNGGTQARTGKKFKYVFKRFDLCWTFFLAILVRVPCDSEQYVRDNYGADWFQPVENWDWKKSPANVKENGVWPQHELNEVVQVIKSRRS